MEAGMLAELVGRIDPRIQSESQVVAELYHLLRSRSGLYPENIVLEAPYPHNPRLKCDMVVKIAGAREVWIEVKGYFSSESASTRSRKHTADRSSPYQSCEKLVHLPSDTDRAIVVYRNADFEPTGGNSWESLSNRCQEQGIVLLNRVCCRDAHAENEPR